MPKIFSDKHDTIMRNFIMTSASKIIGKEKIVLCQNKAGYAVPVTLMIKVMPSLN